MFSDFTEDAQAVEGCVGSDDQVYLPLPEGIRVIFIFPGSDYLYITVVRFGEFSQKPVIQTGFKTVSAVHLVTEIYCAYEFISCICIHGMCSAEDPALLTKWGEADDG